MGRLKRIKAALIGSGAISKNYLSNIKNNFNIIELVGCSDIIPERSAEKAAEYGIRQMTNEEIFRDKDIEIVINTTYPLSHYEVTKAALSAGKHVYSEKMIAVNLEEGKELVELANSKGLLFTMAPDTFLGAGWQAVRHTLDSGLIGEPVSAVGVCIRAYHDTSDDLADRKAFVFSPGGGIPFDMGGYYLHGFIQLFGSISRVSGFAKTRNPVRKYVNPRHPNYGEEFTIDSPNTMTASLEFENGTYVSLTVTSEASLFTKPQFDIHGTEGVLTCFDPNDFNGEILLQRMYNEPKPVTLLHGYADECRGLGVADMAYAIKNKRRPRAHCDMGYHAFEAVHGIWNSCETGKVYTMKSKCPRPEPIRVGQFYGNAQESMLDD
jgi:predicted dehydrogenase